MFQKPGQPEQIVERIQNGENQLRDQLIADSMPEIKHLIRRHTRTFADEHDETFSVAIFAFNQAISQYRADMGACFYSYAGLVIKHRLFDWMRRQKNRADTVSLSEFDEDGLASEDRLADPKSSRIAQDLEIRESLLQLELDLSEFGYTIQEMTAKFPKHRDSQLQCIRISRLLAANEVLYRQMMERRRLPGAELALRCQVPVKTIEKNRGNIIFLVLLMRSDLQVIQTYIDYFERNDDK